MQLLRRSKLAVWLEAVAREAEVYVPTRASQRSAGSQSSTRTDDDTVALAPLGRGEMVLDYGRLAAGGVKGVLFPDRDVLVRVREGAAEPVLDTTRRVLFGIRACDVAAVAYLDYFFSLCREDPNYMSRRENTTLVTVACREPDRGCFCTTAGTGPVSHVGFDLQFYPCGDGYLVQLGSERGSSLVDRARSFFEDAPREAPDVIRRFEEEAAGAVAPAADLEAAARAAGDGELSATFWAELAARCRTCEEATRECPTCTCFQIADRASLDPEWTGERIRTWASCPPGAAPGRRYRDKLEPTGLRTPRFRCVGCGRCVALCPEGLGLRGVIERMLADGARPAGDAETDDS